DNEVIELFAELRPVDNDLMPVEVDVDNEVIELLVELMPVEVEVDNELTLLETDVETLLR
uniref:hypothetical protein n=1 Tax=Burkholderia cepacia TaxID=292 RepID=UPI001FC8AA13